MNYFFKFKIILFFLFVFVASCTSTKEIAHPNDKTANMPWYDRIVNKFSFHTNRDHIEERKRQEQRELEQYYAEIEKNKK